MPSADVLPIEPITKPIEATIEVPGSKSYTNRALAVAALARGASRLEGVLDCEDSRVMLAGLERLGISVRHDPVNRRVSIHGCEGRIPASRADLFLANSGTSIRFLTALVCLGHGTFTLDGVPRMRERPIGDLLDALRSLGVDAQSSSCNDCPPVLVRANGLAGGSVRIRGNVSSQFASALLMVAPLANGPLTIHIDGNLISRPYIDMTLAVMRDFGVQVDRDEYKRFSFSGPLSYQGRSYAIEPDASSASYFFAAAAITGGMVTIRNLGAASLQGDLGFVRLLERMGCRVLQTSSETTVIGGPLHGADFDLGDLSDITPTLAVVACFADSPTRIRNVQHIRRKETDRLAALATELTKAGVEIEEHPDGLTIRPHRLRGVVFDTYDDHRMAMSLALIGLRVADIAIRNPTCTAKTYPDFFSDLAAVCR